MKSIPRLPNDLFQVTLAQISFSVGNIKENTKKIINCIKRQKLFKNQKRLVLFPELALWGYPPRDLLFKKKLQCDNNLAIKEITKSIPPQMMVVVGGVDEVKENRNQLFFNTAYVLKRKKIVQKIYKTFLPNSDVFDELRYFNFSPYFWGNKKKINPKKQVITWAGKKILITICKDIWPQETPFVTSSSPWSNLFQEKKSVDWVVNISASPFEKGKLFKRIKMAQRFIQQFKTPPAIIYLNMVGAQDDLVFDGSSFILNNKGEWVNGLASFQREEKTIEIDAHLKPLKRPVISLHKNVYSEIFAAISLGLKEYLKKSKFQRVLLGLSGGIDSAVVATLASLILGSEKILAVLLPSSFTSSASIVDAQELVKNLKINFLTIPIEKKVNLFRSSFKNKKIILSSLADENIQARIRGLLLMTLSNQNQALLLSTSNKSELAVGYGTLYGDLVGGINVIGDLFKTEIYQLANWINRKHGFLIPTRILLKDPSAELKDNQKDCDSLPDYQVLDRLLKKILIENKEEKELRKLGFNSSLVKVIVQKIKTSEYKRFQSPPILKLSAKAFGRGRRVPLS